MTKDSQVLRRRHAPDNVSLTHPIGPVSYIDDTSLRAPDNGRFDEAVGQVVFDRGEDPGLVFTMLFCSFTNAGIRHRRAQCGRSCNSPGVMIT